jgi:hypothetical protein
VLRLNPSVALVCNVSYFLLFALESTRSHDTVARKQPALVFFSSILLELRLQYGFSLRLLNWFPSIS